VMVSVRWPRSVPSASMLAPVASETRSPFKASREMRACSAAAPSPAATRIAPSSLRSSLVACEHLVDRSVRHVPTLRLPVSFPGMAGTDALRVESHAPAATPDAVVGFDERGEVVPGLRRQHPGRQRHTGSVTDRSDRARLTAKAVTRTGPG
jgi:hypothetical protein